MPSRVATRDRQAGFLLPHGTVETTISCSATVGLLPVTQRSCLTPRTVPPCGILTTSRTRRPGEHVPKIFLRLATATRPDAERIAAHEPPPRFSARYGLAIPVRSSRSKLLAGGGR